jgi:hypothetical protein
VRRGSATLALVGLLVTAVAAVAFVGLGAATVTTDSANFTSVGNDSLANQTIDVTNDTRSLYVELDNDTATASEPVEVAVFEVDADGNETEVDRVQISAADGTTELYEFDALDPTNVSTYRVEVLGTASAIDSSALDVGTVAAVSSGGGFFGGSSGGIGIGAIAVVGIGGYLALKED